MRAFTALVVALTLATTPGAIATAQAPQPRASLPDIEDEVMCVVCGVTLELSTDAPQAIQERELIRRLIARGLTKDQIKDRLVSEFGPEVLAIPGDSGFDLAAWLVPGLAIALGAVGVGVSLRRWRRAAASTSETAAGAAPEGDDARRLEDDMARYEL